MTGVGLGLRWPFLDELFESDAVLPFLEISPENYMRRGGYFPAALSQVRERFPVICHGLTMSVGGTDPLDDAYLTELRRFLASVGASFHSDHLCWSGTSRAMLHDLLPLPFTSEAVEHTAKRVREIQSRLDVPFALENVTYYAPLGEPEMSEAAFIRAVLDESHAQLLLDVNNVYVNAKNHGFDAEKMIDELPLERVVQLHVAGHHEWEGGLLVDTHGAPVPDPVIALMAHVLERTGPLPVLLERDTELPPLADLLAETRALQSVYDEAIARHAQSRGA